MRPEFGRGTQERRHRAFGVRRDEGQASAGFASPVACSGGGDAGIAEFPEVETPEIIVRHPAGIRAATAEGVCGEHGVRRGAARAALGLVLVEAGGESIDAGFVHQGHMALGEVHVAEVGIVDPIFQVDQSVAEAVDVVARPVRVRGMRHLTGACSQARPAKTRSAASRVRATSSSPCVPETNAVSNADGAK